MAARKSKARAPKRLSGLWYHPTGGYAKKHNGRTYYFGKDPEEAAKRYAAEWPSIMAGEAPPAYADGITLHQLCNEFIDDRTAKVDQGDLSPRSLQDYINTCRHMLRALGKNAVVDKLRPSDFGRLRSALAKGRGPVAIANELRRCRVCFNFGYKNFLLAQPVRFGTQFAPPSAKRMREAQNKRGPLLFNAADIESLLSASKPHMRAMVLLGLNAGFGNSDVARLPLSAVDVESGWIDYARAKNAMPRRCPLWPETQEALRASLVTRPTPKAKAADLFFVTTFGSDWAGEHDSTLSKEFRKLLELTKLYRRGLGFYSLRRTFRTHADEVGDDRAAGLVMGHSDPSMAGRYVQQIADERLERVAEYVRKKVLDK